ncbi:MAG: acetyl-CoA carboxylase biotin carboxyl carrier protein [Eubacteriales bacterium]|nr:acetyl-CoA carboxylase biotin carboxyl carrier protein [Eubacteriales bacterium]
MEFEKIIELIHAVSESNVTDFQLQDGDFKLSMETGKTVVQNVPTEALNVPAYTSAADGDGVGSQPASAAQETGLPEGNVVKSPLVGTFYRSSSPDSAPFAEVGDTVKKGQVLGIVEAMKLMNEIESEYDGVVKAILAENGQLTEYGQPLFVIG